MDGLLNKYWSESLTIMKNDFTEVTYETLIKNLIPLYIKDGFFYLKASDSFYKDTIEQRYISNVTEVIRAVTNLDIKAKIVIQEDLDVNINNPKKKVVASIDDNTNLVPKYIFDNFIKGKSNELAYATAVAVAEAPGKTTYNPLFLYGGVGLGKTHLMHSIGNHIKSINPSAKVLYCSTETFMNELINSIQQNKNQEFRDKYRDIDVLLVDDIQFLSNRERTQEEFFHTFNVLRDANKQIVISSDKPPKEIKTLEDRLSSRFGQGIIVDIKLPDFETRNAILEKKAEIDNISVPKDVNRFIAKHVVSNIRDLEGALNKVTAYATLSNTPVTQELAEVALQDLIQKKEKQEINVPYIQEIVANYFNITSDDIRSKKRTQNIAYPRQIAMYLSRKLIDLPLAKIGKSFGDRDHSTVIHGCDKITEMIENNNDLKNTIVEIEKKIIGE